MRSPHSSTTLKYLTTAAMVAVATTPAMAVAAHADTPAIKPQLFATGTSNQTKPDDITALGGRLYVAFQNNAGKDGSPTGSTSTVVAFDPATHNQVATWTLPGRCDGLTAAHGVLYATVNEDNNSSLYVITPTSPSPAHYTYSPNPAEQSASETSSNGGTDSVTIGTDGTVYVAHSNPDPGVGNTAAIYTMTLSGTTASLTRLFGVQDPAKFLNPPVPAPAQLSLSDPDSNRFIPVSAPVLGGTLVQVSQADSQLVLVSSPHTPQQHLSALNLTNGDVNTNTRPQLDDIEEVTGPGTLYVVDQQNAKIFSVDTTSVKPGTLFVSQPAPGTGDNANTADLGTVDPTTGVVTHFNTGLGSPKGLLFVPATQAPVVPESRTIVLLPLSFAAIGGAVIILRRRRSTVAFPAQ